VRRRGRDFVTNKTTTTQGSNFFKGQPTVMRLAVTRMVGAGLLATVGLWALPGTANAQKAYYQGRAETDETVIIDLSVLDQLGQPPNLPGMLRPTQSTGQRSVPPDGSIATRPRPATPRPQPATPRPATPRTAPASAIEAPAAVQPRPAQPRPAQPRPTQPDPARTAGTSASSAPVQLQPAPDTAPRSSLNVPENSSVETPSQTARAPSSAGATTPPPKPSIADEPAPEPAPQPVPQPASAPEPEPAPQPAPEPEPEATPEPTPTAKADPEPSPEPEPEPAATPEPPASDTASDTAAATAPPPKPSIADEPAPEPAATASADDAPAALPEMEEPSAAKSQSAAESTSTQVAAIDPSIIVERDEGLSVLFDPGAQDLPEGAEAALDQVAQQMKADGELRLRLRGYALANGDTANQSRRVSLFRALAVRTYLMKRDVSSRRMDVQALGANQPTDGGSSNRVDVILQQ